MCVVSMVGDHYGDKWDPWKKYIPNQPSPLIPEQQDPSKAFEDFLKKINPNPQTPTRQEFEDLKKEVEDLKSLLKRAKEYDEKNNEPNCEIEEKMKLLKEIAKLVGVNLDEILKNGKQFN